ncbi:MAG: imidazole glycerol phosphate synthase subunit HisH [Alphaproteobacteria bacterium]
MHTALIDYGSGNLRSAAKAAVRAAADSSLANRITVTSDPKVVRAADRIILPGQGAFADCRHGVQAVPGLEEALIEVVQKKQRPFFGICVGMQLMATKGLEHGSHKGFNWVKGEVAALTPKDPSCKVPHMGWNALQLSATAQQHPIFKGISSGAHAYFAHSYVFIGAPKTTILATTDHGGEIIAAIGCDNMVGTQFHPEKSQAIGIRLLSNFLSWSP